MIAAISPSPILSLPATALDWAEGIAYSRDGAVLAVSEMKGDRVTLFQADSLERLGEVSGPFIRTPHDIAFSKDDRLLAVANREARTVTLHENTGSPGSYSSVPASVLRRRDWVGTTAVKFDSSGECVVVVNHSGSVTCFRPDGSVVWEIDRAPCFAMPDGVALSHDGALLAIAHNASHEVTLHRRGDPWNSGTRGYDPSPFVRLQGLRHPHSLAFTDDGLELAVTNSGGPTIALFRPVYGGIEWEDSLPAMQWPACDYEVFLRAHYACFIESGETLACEGGPKGLTLSPDSSRIAWSGPSFGLRVHTCEQRRPV
jgi:6-phosphogluconolactonase (cycloisomerase 2 family)